MGTSPSSFKRQHRRPPEYELRKLYVFEKRSHRQLADHYEVGVATVHRWLEGLGLLEQRKRADADRRRRRPRKRRRLKYYPDVLRRRAETHSAAQLAKMYGVTRQTMYAWLEAEGITAVDGRTSPRRKASPPVPELEAMRDKGMTLAQIGERYGVSRQRVHQWLQAE